jgi:hypothetical protein
MHMSTHGPVRVALLIAIRSEHRGSVEILEGFPGPVGRQAETTHTVHLLGVRGTFRLVTKFLVIDAKALQTVL